MSDDYGRLMSNALAAVRRMHADTSRLLVDADGTLGRGKVSVFGSYATIDLTYSNRAEHWMAEGVFRLYAAKPPSADNAVEGVTVRFFDRDGVLEEPYLVVGRIVYGLGEGRPLIEYLKDLSDRADKRAWHLWLAYSAWAGGARPGVVLTGGPLPSRRVEWFGVVGVPLFSVGTMEQVAEMMDRVRAAVPGGSATA